MKKFFAVLITAVALAFTAGTATAADWDYVKAGVIANDVRDVSFNAYTVGGSKALGDLFFVQGNYTNANGNEFSAAGLDLSVGARAALLPRSDVYGKVTGSALINDIGSFDQYSWRVEGGIRTQVLENVEMRAGVVAADMHADPRGWTWMGTAGAEVAFNDNLRVGLDVRGRDKILIGELAARWYF